MITIRGAGGAIGNELAALLGAKNQAYTAVLPQSRGLVPIGMVR